MKVSFRITIAIALTLIAAGTSACLNDGESQTNLTEPSVSIPGTVVVKAALVDALWDLTDDPDPNAVCVANSTFKFTAENPLTIQKNLELTEYNLSKVVVVESITIDMPEGSEGRAAECESGALKYIVSASKDSPVDIDTADELSGKQNLETVAKQTPTPYPGSCEITAHFERSGEEVYVAEEDPPVEDDDVEVVSETDDSDDVEENEVADDETPPEAATIYSLVLIVDTYDCTQNATAPALNPRSPAYNSPAGTN